jgi:cell division protein FtsI (penicillin-binding protein 3)
MAVSTPVDSVWVNPKELLSARDKWPRLAAVLKINYGKMERMLAKRLDREFVYLQRHVSPALADKVVALEIPGVFLQREYKRFYPMGEVAAHVVGFTNVDDLGQEGMELAHNDWLRSTPGAKRVMRDRLGRVFNNVESIRQSQAGKDLVLSVDRRLQYLAYRELKAAVKRHKAVSGSAVMLDAQSGEVLAMVSQPSFNPNNRSEYKSANYRNRAVTDVFEPGSTIKPFTVAAALEQGRFTPASVIDTSPGFFKVGGGIVKDIRNYGAIDVSTVIQKSSNVGASKIALAIDAEAFWSTLSTAGIGEDTGSGFPGESDGLLNFFSQWRTLEQATLAFGYGLSVTPLQLAQSYAVFANDGKRPGISFQPVSSEQAREQQVQVISDKTARAVRRMMEAVVADGGTATQARVPGYRVAGKTGTVKKAGVGGYLEDKYISIFAGMAPASNPRLVMVVMIDEPRDGEYYGGVVAAPVFSRVMSGALRLMDIPPDDSQYLGTRMALAEGM